MFLQRQLVNFWHSQHNQTHLYNYSSTMTSSKGISMIKKQPYSIKNNKMQYDLKPLQDIFGSIEGGNETISQYLESRFKTHTIFMYWIPKLCSKVYWELKISEIELDLSFLLEMHGSRITLDVKDIFIPAIQHEDGSMVPTGSCFVLLPNSLINSIPEPKLDLLIYESGLHISKVPIPSLLQQIEEKLTLVFDINFTSVTKNTPHDEIHFTALENSSRDKLLILIKSLSYRYLLMKVHHTKTLTMKLLITLFPSCPWAKCFIFKGSPKSSRYLQVLVAGPNTDNFYRTSRAYKSSLDSTDPTCPMCEIERWLDWNDFRSILISFGEVFVHDTLYTRMALQEPSEKVHTPKPVPPSSRRKKRSERAVGYRVIKPSSASISSISNGVSEKGFEENLLHKMQDLDIRSRFVTEKLPDLLKLGNTVIKIESLPANLSTQGLNLMMGTYGLKKSQIVGVIASNGNKQKNNPGLMNIRIVMNSDDKDLNRLLDKNNLKTPNQMRLRVKKTNVKDLENFLSKYHDRIHLLG